MKEIPTQRRERDVDSPHPTRIGVEALYRAHSPFIASFLARLGVPRREVPDLVHDVFIIAHRQGGYREGAARPKSWLGGIAFRVAAKYRRKMRPALGVAQDVDDRRVDDSTPEAALEARQAAERVHRCLESLDLKHRAVFVLFEIEDVGGNDIAQMLGIPVGTVYRRLHHARRAFAQAHEAETRR